MSCVEFIYQVQYCYLYSWAKTTDSCLGQLLQLPQLQLQTESP